MSDDRAFSLLLSGDSMITRGALTTADEPARGLRDLVRNADLAFTNLEVLPNDFKGYPGADHGGTHLAARSTVVDELIDIGFDLIAAATNHALDYHIEGLLATIEVLERKGVAFAGLGRTLGEARMPVYLDHPAGVLAMLSCCSTFSSGQQAGDQRPDMQGRPGLNPLRYDRVYEIPEEELATLRKIAGDLGIDRQRLGSIQMGFGFPPDDPEIFPFLGASFRAATTSAAKTTPLASDSDAMAKWVHEARARADLVMVSFHAHEEEGSVEEPAAFIPTFAHRMIDEGADLVVGHGPHLLRGMEIYHGHPIFYSLGNFIAQNHLVHKLPADAYNRFRVDPARTPSELFASREQNGKIGFSADARYWESVVPTCHYDGSALQSIELTPISLGYGEPAHHRGRPRLVQGEHATAILNRFAALSEPYGTRIDINGDRAQVVLTN
jgi:poly-gamma-glutamate capsule biosynthesis protein CapA/YwtB (metallophosphatase superfamily)